MKQFSLRVTAEAPLAIRADHAPDGAAGARYIPGPTLMGGLASLHRLFYREKADVDMFAPLFLKEQVRYSHLYPAFFDDPGLQVTNTPVYPLPKTAQSCKRHPGFRYPYKEENDGHGARDTLIDWALFTLAAKGSQGDAQRLVIMQDSQKCTCGAAMDHFEGYYRRSDIAPYPTIKALPERYNRLQTRTGIDRESGTVQDGILYNRQVFDEGMEFWGQVSLQEDEQLIKHFERFVQDIGHTGLLHLGTGRTRGMGKVRFTIDPFKEAQVSFEAFTQRLSSFNALLLKRAHSFGMPTLPYSYFFALTLHAPLLLCDELLRYQSALTTETLEEQLGHSLPGLERVFYASGIQRVTGWQELWGTPRAGELAIESGSIFLFACPTPPDETQFRALFDLEEQGIGKRRAEGFGRIGISDWFHQHILKEKEEPPL